MPDRPGARAAKKTASPRRVKIGEEVGADVRFAVDSRCCLCEWHGAFPPPRTQNGQIHHLDGDRSNSDPDNLVWLCLDHHEEAGKKGRVSRNLSPATIRRYRTLLQRTIARQRSNWMSSVPKGRSVFAEVLDALVVLDVQKTRRRSGSGDDEWKAAETAIWEVSAYPEAIGFEARRAILDFLYDLASDARHDMPRTVAFSIRHCAVDLLQLHYLYANRHARTTRQNFELLSYGVEVGRSLAYDGALYLRNLRIVDEGCEILWHILSYATIHRHRKLRALVLDGFETALDGATRSGLSTAVTLVREARQHGEAAGHRSPEYSEAVMRAL